jgi:hypothetical protein
VNHADIKKHMADYLEGDLALEDRALVDAHLDHCNSCSMEIEEMLQTIRLLRTLPEPEIPPMIAANVMRRIRTGESRPGFFQRVSRGVQSILEPTFVLPASAIAVAALVFTVSQGTWTPETLTQGIWTQGTLTQGTPTQEARSPSSPSLVMKGAGQGERTWVRDSATGSQTLAALPSLISVNATRGAAVRGTGADGRGLSVRSDGAVPGPTRVAPRTIRLRVDGSGVARLSMSRRSASQPPAGPLRSAGVPVFTSAVPEEWAAQFSRVMYGDRASLAGGEWVSADHSARGSDGLVQSVARSQTFSQDRILADLERGGADPRDAWLALGFEDPAEFARYIASQNLAEQELWAARLSERAEERGLLVEFLQVLRESGDVTASWVAGDFAAQADARSERDVSAGSEASPLR